MAPVLAQGQLAQLINYIKDRKRSLALSRGSQDLILFLSLGKCLGDVHRLYFIWTRTGSIFSLNSES